MTACSEKQLGKHQEQVLNGTIRSSCRIHANNEMWCEVLLNSLVINSQVLSRNETCPLRSQFRIFRKPEDTDFLYIMLCRRLIVPSTASDTIFLRQEDGLTSGPNTPGPAR